MDESWTSTTTEKHKAYIHMEIEQLYTQRSLSLGRNEEIKDFLDLNGNGGKTHPNLWDTVKALLRGKIIALNTFIKKLALSHTNDLKGHMQSPEKKANIPRRSRGQNSGLKSVN